MTDEQFEAKMDGASKAVTLALVQSGISEDIGLVLMCLGAVAAGFALQLPDPANGLDAMRAVANGIVDGSLLDAPH